MSLGVYMCTVNRCFYLVSFGYNIPKRGSTNILVLHVCATAPVNVEMFELMFSYGPV